MEGGNMWILIGVAAMLAIMFTPEKYQELVLLALIGGLIVFLAINTQ